MSTEKARTRRRKVLTTQGRHRRRNGDTERDTAPDDSNGRFVVESVVLLRKRTTGVRRERSEKTDAEREREGERARKGEAYERSEEAGTQCRKGEVDGPPKGDLGEKEEEGTQRAASASRKRAGGVRSWERRGSPGSASVSAG